MILVSVKITDFHTYTMWNGLFIFFMTCMILLTGIFYDLFYVKTDFLTSTLKRVFIISGIRLGLLIYVLIAQHDMLEDSVTTAVYFVVLAVLLGFFALLDYRFMQAPAEISGKDTSVIHTIINRNNAYTYYVFTLVAQILIYIPIFYFAYGYNTACYKTEFLSVEIDNTKQVIVGMYDACYIFKSITDIENRNVTRFKKVDPKSLDGLELEWITVSLKEK